MRSGWSNGGGVSSTESITLKIAVLTLIPSASVRRAPWIVSDAAARASEADGEANVVDQHVGIEKRDRYASARSPTAGSTLAARRAGG